MPLVSRDVTPAAFTVQFLESNLEITQTPANSIQILSNSLHGCFSFDPLPTRLQMGVAPLQGEAQSRHKKWSVHGVYGH